jgi:diadenosine tetraphosphatase ApaH/serine/threonine PP2A family protein phosphatase
MPRYLLLSDIHANLTALEAVLAAAKGRWDSAVCLGDVIGYGPDPNEVVDRIVGMGIRTIRGNHDKAGSGVEDSEDFNPIARAAVEWTNRQLRPENLQWLRELPAGPLINDGIAFVHGALGDEDEYVFTVEGAARSLREAPMPLTFFGHTHVQGGFLMRNGRVEGFRPSIAPGMGFVPMELDPDARYLINPGSIGQPRDGDPRAAFVVAEPERQRVEFWRVPYDIEAVQKRMEEAGLPEPLVLRLAFGR